MLSPRPAAAVVVGAALFSVALVFLGASLADFAHEISSPAWPLLLIGFLVAVAAGSLLVSAATSIAGLITRAVSRRARQSEVASAQMKRASEEAEQVRGELDAHLRELKPAERSFLDLFASRSNTAKLMETGLLPHEVYVGASHLIQRKIIERVTSRTDAPYTERYRLREPAVALVQSVVLNQPIGTREIVLDLSKVEGSRASGSGARGS